MTRCISVCIYATFYFIVGFQCMTCCIVLFVSMQLLILSWDFGVLLVALFCLYLLIQCKSFFTQSLESSLAYAFQLVKLSELLPFLFFLQSTESEKPTGKLNQSYWQRQAGSIKCLSRHVRKVYFCQKSCSRHTYNHTDEHRHKNRVEREGSSLFHCICSIPVHICCVCSLRLSITSFYSGGVADAVHSLPSNFLETSLS